MQAVHKTYSGYVHGASPHIMEMYGPPGRFHMNGLRATPFWHDHADDFWNYMYRGLMSFAMAANAFGDAKLFTQIREYCRTFEASEPQRD